MLFFVVTDLTKNFLDRFKDFSMVIEPTNTVYFRLKFDHTVGNNKVSFKSYFCASGRFELYNLFEVSSDHETLCVRKL